MKVLLRLAVGFGIVLAILKIRKAINRLRYARRHANTLREMRNLRPGQALKWGGNGDGPEVIYAPPGSDFWKQYKQSLEERGRLVEPTNNLSRTELADFVDYLSDGDLAKILEQSWGHHVAHILPAEDDAEAIHQLWVTMSGVRDWWLDIDQLPQQQSPQQRRVGLNDPDFKVYLVDEDGRHTIPAMRLEDGTVVPAVRADDGTIVPKD